VAIHWQQGQQPIPRVTSTVPANTEAAPAEPPPGRAEPAKLSNVSDTPAPSEAPAGAEPTPMRAARVRAIWGLIAISLLPGIVAALAPALWHALPSWAHWTTYGFCGVLILTIVWLIVTHDAARE